MEAWSEYLVDSVQRAVLFWDVMRKRGDIFLENTAKGEPPVLIFDYDSSSTAEPGPTVQLL